MTAINTLLNDDYYILYSKAWLKFEILEREIIFISSSECCNSISSELNQFSVFVKVFVLDSHTYKSPVPHTL